MLSLTLESLVLHGVCARDGGKALTLRLGTSGKVDRQAPEVRISMRHPSCGPRAFAPAGWPVDVGNPGVDGVPHGAGRSLRLAGVLSRSAARTAGRAFPFGWPHGGQAAAAANPGRITAGSVASVREVPSRRLAVAGTGALPQRGYRRSARCCPTATPAWCKPAVRTPPASTWGTAVR
jgi:hypothetical protein